MQEGIGSANPSIYNKKEEQKRVIEVINTI